MDLAGLPITRRRSTRASNRRCSGSRAGRPRQRHVCVKHHMARFDERASLGQLRRALAGAGRRVRPPRPAARIDAATAMAVLMYLPDDGAKLHLRRGVTCRHKPGAPLLLVDSLRDHRQRFLLAMERYAAARGMPAEQLAAGGRAHPRGRHDRAGGARTGAAGRGHLHDERLGRRAVNSRIGGRIADCPITAHSAPHSPDRP